MYNSKRSREISERRVKEEKARGYQTAIGAVILISILGCGAVAHPDIVWDARHKDGIRDIYEQQQQINRLEKIRKVICRL